MMLPILISVSLAPGSYFFCAWAVVATMAATASAVMATSFCMRTGIVFSPFFQSCCGQVSQVASTLASMCLFRMTKRHCCPAPIVIDAGSRHYHAYKAQRLDRLKPDIRIGPRHPRLAGLGFRFARWLAAKTMGLAGFHQLDSEFADARIALVRAKLARGETVYLAGLGAPGMHNSGL